MKCPVCKKKLKLINPLQSGEYICDNESCPLNVRRKNIYAEFYGKSQAEIDDNKF